MTEAAVQVHSPLRDDSGAEADVERDRIRALQFLTAFALGGTERQVVNLALTLDPARFAPYFGCLHRWGELLGEITARGIPIMECQITKLYNLRAYQERLRFARYLRRERIQIVHAYNFYANLFAVPAARLSGVPVIVASVRDMSVNLTPLRRRAQRIACHLAHRVAVNAEAIRQQLTADGHDPEKVVVIRNGVDLSKFSGRRGDGRIRQELGLPPQALLVAVLSRLIQQKGVEHFIEAAAIVARRIPAARFLVVGDQWVATANGGVQRDVAYRNELETCAARLGLGNRVVFTGFRLDVPELLSEVAVSVLPSVGAEGLSNVLLEAAAAGVPVVATNVGGNGEAVQDGVTGLLVPPRDPQALARAICYLLDHGELAAQFGAAGRERIVRYFSMERCARETERLYLDLLATAARRDPTNAVPSGRDRHSPVCR